MSKLNPEEVQGVAFQIILESGDARTIVHEAFGLMREGKLDEAEVKLEEANEAIVRAHGSQTDLLQKFAGGASFEIDILMVHSQDHLMTTMTLREVAIEMLHLYSKVG
ncbi:MAG: PTS cellobiose transporter subunit IIA [Turicibacter sp.]|nr:PTS cellobiose transporter subunit IIA [Turicibacter sp.]